MAKLPMCVATEWIDSMLTQRTLKRLASHPMPVWEHAMIIFPISVAFAYYGYRSPVSMAWIGYYALARWYRKTVYVDHHMMVEDKYAKISQRLLSILQTKEPGDFFSVLADKNNLDALYDTKADRRSELLQREDYVAVKEHITGVLGIDCPGSLFEDFLK